MINDYECPKCHNVFPSQNKYMHDAHCTEQNPMPLDKSRQEELNKLKNSNNSNSKMEISQVKKPEEIPKNDNSQSIPKLSESQLKKSSQSGEFPDIFVCEICGETLAETEKKDHMYCHTLENEERNLVNNENNLEVSQGEIDRQRQIERQIERENELRRNMQNQQRQGERQNDSENSRQRNQNNLMDSNINMLSESDVQFFGNIPGFGMNSNMNNQNNMGSNGSRQVRIERVGPNGERIVQQFSSSGNGGMPNMMINQMMNPMNMMFSSSSSGNRQRPIINFNSFIRPGGFDINSFFEQFLQGIGRHENPTDQEILNNLPETQIDDVTKLDPEKKNCVICLEDFKNGDKATVLPCIHIFHTSCIQNWLKTQNCCPICKFKLTGENINSQP